MDTLLATLARDGKFGPGSYISSSVNNNVGIGQQFVSKITFMKVLINRGRSVEILEIVVKKQSYNPLFSSKGMFTNELIMYEKILPFIKAEQLNIYPKLYYGFVSSDEDTNEDILLMEDVRKEDFTAAQKLCLNYDQLVLALKKLGQFHSLSYLAKREYNGQFFSTVKLLRESSIFSEHRKQLNYLVIVRVLKSLIFEGIEVDLLNEVLNKFSDYNAATELLIKPEEPYSVVCHGDFCLNNLLFKYNNSEIPVNIKFVDFQTSIYSTPAVDLSFLLYLNTEADLREQYWDDFLKIYWESFSENITNLEFNFQQFLEHFAKRAVYGLYISACFLFIILEEDNKVLTDIFHMTDDERIELANTFDGKKGIKALVSISKHILKKNYFHKFLELH